MMTRACLSIFSLYFLAASPAAAQCPFDPALTGNLLVCPDSFTTLGTQAYDAYQWYRRPFPNGQAAAIPGATGPTLDVAYLETPVYISVVATQNGCSETSPEVLVDGLAFLPVTVLSEGDFQIGPNGEHIICQGDTVFLIALQPYTINFQWYDGPDAIPGAHDDTLVVTQPGNFWLTASPAECPNFTASLGLQIPVIWGSSPGCTTATAEPPPPFDLTVMPNPARASLLIGVDVSGILQARLFNAVGQAIRQKAFSVSTELETGDLPPGVYTLVVQSETGSLSRQVVVQPF